MNQTSNFGLKLRKLRLDRNVTITTLADAIGVGRRSIYRWEHTPTVPDAKIIILIAEFFQIEIEYFFTIDNGSDAEISKLWAEIHNLRTDFNNLHTDLNILVNNLRDYIDR